MNNTKSPEERVAKGWTPYPSNYLVMEALRDIDGDRFPVRKGDLRSIRFGYTKPDFVPRVVAQARAGETLDWGGASVFTDAYRVVYDGQGPLPDVIASRMPQPIPVQTQAGANAIETARQLLREIVCENKN